MIFLPPTNIKEPRPTDNSINSEVIPVDWEELDKQSILKELIGDTQISGGAIAIPQGGNLPPINLPSWLTNIGASAAGAAEFGAKRAIPAAISAASSSPLSFLAALVDPFSVAASSQGYDPSALYQPWEIPSEFSVPVDYYPPGSGPTYPGGVRVPHGLGGGPKVPLPNIPVKPGEMPVPAGPVETEWEGSGTKKHPKTGQALPDYGTKGDTKGDFGEEGLEIDKSKIDPKLEKQYGKPPPQPKGPDDPKDDWKSKFKRYMDRHPWQRRIAKGTLGWQAPIINELQELVGLPDYTPLDMLVGGLGKGLDAASRGLGITGPEYSREWREMTVPGIIPSIMGEPILESGELTESGKGVVKDFNEFLDEIKKSAYKSERGDGSIAVPESTATSFAINDTLKSIIEKAPYIEEHLRRGGTWGRFTSKDLPPQKKYKGGYVKGYQGGGLVEEGGGYIDPNEISPWQPGYEETVSDFTTATPYKTRPHSVHARPRPGALPDWQYNPYGGAEAIPSTPEMRKPWGEKPPSLEAPTPTTPEDISFLNMPWNVGGESGMSVQGENWDRLQDFNYWDSETWDLNNDGLVDLIDFNLVQNDLGVTNPGILEAMVNHITGTTPGGVAESEYISPPQPIFNWNPVWDDASFLSQSGTWSDDIPQWLGDINQDGVVDDADWQHLWGYGYEEGQSSLWDDSSGFVWGGIGGGEGLAPGQGYGNMPLNPWQAWFGPGSPTSSQLGICATSNNNKRFQEGGFVKDEDPGTFPIYPEWEGELTPGVINPYDESPFEPDHEPDSWKYGTVNFPGGEGFDLTPPDNDFGWIPWWGGYQGNQNAWPGEGLPITEAQGNMPLHPDFWGGPTGGSIEGGRRNQKGGLGVYNPKNYATPVTGEGNYLNPPESDWTMPDFDLTPPGPDIGPSWRGIPPQPLPGQQQFAPPTDAPKSWTIPDLFPGPPGLGAGAGTAMDWTPGEGPTGYQEIDPFAPTGGGVDPIIPDNPWFNPDWWVTPPGEEEDFPVVDPVYTGKVWGGAGGGYVPLNGLFRK